MAKAFQFRLERLLDLRRAKETAVQRVFAEARRAVEEESCRLAGLLAEENAGREASRALRQGALDLTALRLQEGWQSAVDGRIRTSRTRLADLGRVEIEKRRALTEAMKAVKVLERFRERRWKEWTQAADREERKVLDEAGRVREGA